MGVIFFSTFSSSIIERERGGLCNMDDDLDQKSFKS